MGRVQGTIARLAIATALCSAVVPLPASAQGTLNDSLASKVKGGQSGSRLLVEAREIVYDNDRNTVSAQGDVELNYEGRTLQADRVTYDRNTGRVLAEGKARLTEADGAVATADRFELTDDFKSGFIDSLRVEQTQIENGQPVKTRFTAPRGERIDGESTVFQSGTYTACEPCAKNPERPPLWQVKAARIIHNNSERTIYYENASLEFLGVPIAYVPYFWSPDPTVKRKTGFLAPTYIASSAVGTGVSIPFFWALAPNYDLTFRPAFLSRQGVLGQVEWRHQLLTGSYNIRAAGIFQQDKDAFLPSPYGAKDKNFRGSLESTGRFYLNERWAWGWDVALMTDKWFLQNYRIRSESIASNYVRESISTLYLTGQGDRSWFDLRGYYFKGLSTYDYQKQQPVVHPVLDYNKRINGPAPLGGEVAFDVNLTSLSREASQFQPLSASNSQPLFTDATGAPYGSYTTCIVFDRTRCLIPGIGGTSTRVSAQASWRRRYVDDFGQTWTPFGYVRADGIWFSPTTTGYRNAQVGNYVDGDDEFLGRLTPAIGLEYRFPLIASAGAWGTHTVEPIAQIVARPSESRIGQMPNEDAQSLVFDDTNIFSWDKFSGYDRVEGGVRANYGVQYSFNGTNGFYGNAMVGQSVQVAGRNSFAPGDLVNVGRDSGLEERRSDYVGRLHLQPNRAMALTVRGRFDEDDLAMKRFETTFSGAFGPITASATYARYAPQPELGYEKRREGVLGALSYNLTQNWFVNGSVLLDLDRYLDARERYVSTYTAYQTAGLDPSTVVYDRSTRYAVGALSLGAGYRDECTTFTVTYTAAPKDGSLGSKEQTRTVLMRLELRTLGEASVTQNLGGSTSSQDGISQ